MIHPFVPSIPSSPLLRLSCVHLWLYFEAKLIDNYNQMLGRQWQADPHWGEGWPTAPGDPWPGLITKDQDPKSLERTNPSYILGPPRIRRNSQKSFLKKGQFSWKSCSITLSGGSYQWWLLPHRYPKIITKHLSTSSSHCHQPLPILIFIVNSWRQRELWNLGLDRKARQRGWEEGGDEERSGLVVVVMMMIMMTMVMIYQFVFL